MSGRRRFARFLVVGSIASAVNIVSRIVLDTTLSFEVSIPLAYVIAMIVAYTLNRSYVFASSGRSMWDEMIRFLIVNAFGAAQVWLVSVGLARLIFPAIGFLWHAETVAHVIGVGSPIFTSYLGHKHISFRAKP